ncbi:FAD/NAD-P-binding domain-containing protein [Coprinopsis marcescibilis]|uniref:FAD/NAD-P-binding domain-containing protein n=1 Tax=Coprinopsis marcescibilis TaxID=230819 RepID=A0A5C3KY97_COPMA|nr:FAD/NAD-P-binding domain-containing protein [Coprinopsis marcescibilis]
MPNVSIPTAFSLDPSSIDEARPMKVIVIGAGYTGIISAIRFPQKVKNLDFVVYEANAGVGGVWYSHRYPGLACDNPAHCYQLTFEPNKNWSSFYPGGPEIQSYLEGVVDKYKLWPYIKLQHKVVRAQYDELTGKWTLKIRRPKVPVQGQSEGGMEFEEFEDTADIVLSAMGALGRWNWPDISGLAEYKGKLIHSAEWETGEGDPLAGWRTTVKSWASKRVAVIGVSSSGTQIVTALQPRVGKLVNYARSKTWMTVLFGHDKMHELAKDPNAMNYQFTDEDKKGFEDPVEYLKFRKSLEQLMQNVYPVLLTDHPMQAHIRKLFTQYMKAKLAAKPEIAESLTPDFPFGIRRPVPDSGFLNAVCQDNVEFEPGRIAKITETGIEAADGKHQEFDAIVCATGYDLSFDYRFPILGRKGRDLKDEWSGPYPRTYLSIATRGFPNWFQSLGPNGMVPGGSLTLGFERLVDYVVEVTLKLQRDRYKSIEARKEAVDGFDRFADSYFKKTVYGQPYASTYKAGNSPDGRVFVIWPGAPLHLAKALKNPRWEDYSYESTIGDEYENIAWLGDGTTLANMDPNADRAWYVDPENIDFPEVPTEGTEAT